MNTLPFIAFTGVFAGLVYAHFFLAYRAWRTSRDEQPSDIDPNYVRLEDYFARSFRLKVSNWLKLPVEASYPDGSLLIMNGQERIWVSPSADYASETKSEDVQVVKGSFRCGAGCVFTHEIYAGADASVGPGTRLQSIAADGNLTLGSDVCVTRWADSNAEMEIGTNSIVRARATAVKGLLLRNGARVASAFASKVYTTCNGPLVTAEPAGAPAPDWEIPPADTGFGPLWQGDAGVDVKNLKELGGGCWLCRGDFKPSAAVRVKTKLIVKGDCIIPSGSVLERDLKAQGFIYVGPRSICRGNVVAGSDILFGPQSRFYGIVHAGKSLCLSQGVRGGEEEVKVAAFGADKVSVEEDVVVYGKLASGGMVVAVTEGGGPKAG